LITCARKDCSIEFEPATHNQKYHNSECCRIATNSRIMEKYYDKRDQKNGKVRFCESGCGTKLSRYNDSKTCSGCETRQSISANRTVADMLLNVNWQTV
jgi:hypothetical protein